MDYTSTQFLHNSPIHSIALMMSIGCNLQCDYCLINEGRQRNPAYAANLQKETIKALRDGTFRQNVRNGLLAMYSSPNDVIRMEFWGQEPTLTMQYFVEDIQGWVDDFPNWTELFFSTNGQWGADKLIGLVLGLDQALTHKFKLALQFSYDGEYSNINLRHDKDLKVLQTIQTVLETLNGMELHNVSVDIYLHGVISFALIQSLNGDVNKIREFWESNEHVADELMIGCTNRSVKIFPGVSATEETPYACSIEDAFAFADFVEKSLLVGTQAAEGLLYLSRQFSNILKMSKPDWDGYNLDQVLDLINESIDSQNTNLAEFTELTRKLASGFYCSTGLSDLKFGYDGTLITCQNSIYETKIENINPEHTVSYDARRNFVKSGLYINPLTCTEEEKIRYRRLFMEGKQTTFWFTWNSVVNQMYFLARAGQISDTYLKDIHKILKHAYIICYINQCYFNNSIMTGSMWTKDTGLIRKYCNGMCEILEERENISRQEKGPKDAYYNESICPDSPKYT